MAKQYKTWELIKAWQEGERGQYVHEHGDKINLEKCGITYWLGNGKPVVLTKTNCESLWTKVQKPVDFMTAINSGKKIKPVDCNRGDLALYQKIDGAIYDLAFQSPEEIRELINGKWLIEEE